VPKTTESSSDNYFDSRGSKLGAVVSNQSEVVFFSLAFKEKKWQNVRN
jgi:pyridoxine/pyridoxamine 5'-phosphate oxidase